MHGEIPRCYSVTLVLAAGEIVYKCEMTDTFPKLKWKGMLGVYKSF